MIMIIISGVIALAALGFIIFFYFSMRKKQKEWDETLGDVKTRLDDFNRSEKEGSAKAMKDLVKEKDKKTAFKKLRFVTMRYSKEKGIEALDHFERRFAGDIDEKERKDLKLLRSRVLYATAHIGDEDVEYLDEARGLAEELLGDREFCENEHMKLVIEEHLRHIALEKRIKLGVG